MKKLASKLLFLGGLLLLPQCQSPIGLARPPDALVVDKVAESGRTIAKERKLEYLGFGLSDLVDAPSDATGAIWSLNLVDRRQLTLEQAREEVLAIYDEYKRLTLDNPAFMDAYQDYCHIRSRESRFTEDNIGIKLAFWDPCNDRPCPPYVAQIKVARKTIRYFFVADDTQRLGEPVTETVDQARSHSNISH